jgi:hypothetical protein
MQEKNMKNENTWSLSYFAMSSIFLLSILAEATASNRAFAAASPSSVLRREITFG